MSRGMQTFRKRDVERAIKAATDAGHNPTRVEINKAGKSVLILNEAMTSPSTEKEWNAALNDR